MSPWQRPVHSAVDPAVEQQVHQQVHQQEVERVHLQLVQQGVHLQPVPLGALDSPTYELLT